MTSYYDLSALQYIPHIPHSYTITVWYAFLSHSFSFLYPHKVMDEYRRCRHRSIKFQALTGVMKSAFWQEQVFLLYHFFRYLCNSSILSIIPNKETRETVAHYWTRYILCIDYFEFLPPRWRSINTSDAKFLYIVLLINQLFLFICHVLYARLSNLNIFLNIQI